MRIVAPIPKKTLLVRQNSPKKMKKKIPGYLKPFTSKSSQIWDHFFTSLFPMDSENLKSLDIKLREVGAQGQGKQGWTNEKNMLNIYFAVAILHPLWAKVFKSEIISYFTFPHWTLGSAGKNTVKWSEKVWQTDRKTHKQTQIQTFWLIERIGQEGRFIENFIHEIL